jgi:cyclase
MSSPVGHARCQNAAPSSARLHQLADGVHAWVQPDGSWWINNAGAVSGADGTIIIDTCATEVRTRRFLAAVDDATGGAPIRTAVNTHEHGDHTHGNSLLPVDAAIIAHAHARRSMESHSLIGTEARAWDPVPDWGAVALRLPSITVDDRVTIHAGGRRVEVLHPGYAAHTDGDLVAWLPDERILFTGDLVFHGLTPLVYAGSVTGALQSLDWVAGFGTHHLVPGHGPVATGSAVESVLDEHRRYYRLVLEAAGLGRRRGMTALEAAQQTDLGEFAAWADPERLVLNLHRAYAEADGSTVHVSQAFRDAMIWNGGPLTTHVCCSGDAAGPGRDESC